MELTKRQLDGLPREMAECFGKPHIMACYTGPGIDSYRHDDGICFLSGRPITNAHHIVHKGTAQIFNLRSTWGIFPMRTALIGVDGTGTTGTHGAFHANRLKARWVWDSQSGEEAWWSGLLLAHGMEPHSPSLYDIGHWEIEDSLGRIHEWRNL